MSAEVLVDTNVLVYAYDLSEPVKQQQASHILNHLTLRGSAAISTQVLSEFFVTVTRKIAEPLSVGDAYERLENYLQSWVVLEMSGLVVLEAARGVRDYRFNFWDAQIWAVAHLNQIASVFSEDFSNDSVIEGVRFVNPFAPDFQIADW
jgi:predicted nucleic acid-binding protein